MTDSQLPQDLHQETIIPRETRPWALRHGFPGWIMGLGWSVTSFLSFQVIAGIAAIVVLFVFGRTRMEDFSPAILYENLDVMFISNSIGQILFLGLFTWIVARLSATRSERPHFLRLMPPANPGPNYLLAFLVVLVAQPVIMVLAWINLQFPFSETYLVFEQNQLKLIEDYLRSDHVLLFTLFHVAVVPSICEEVLFRGYVLSNFQRSMLPWVAIVLSGLLFGLYHVRLTQLIPLSVLGMVLAWMTIRTGSIWPAVVAHFANNASAVVLATFLPDVVFADGMQGSLPPWYFIITSIFLSGLLLYLIRNYNPIHQQPETYV
jgi:uncharacterized protein